MSALHTIEVRWFPTTQPFPIADYFEDAHQAPERTDWYAVPCDDGSGVKLREGRLETKLRSASLGQFDFSDAITGNLETWSKWGVELDPTDAPTERILAAANWLSVTKLRYVRRFEISGNQISETLERPENGCSFELTKLTIDGHNYWTTGFEAVMQPAEQGQRSLQDNLCKIFDLIMAERPLPAASVETSIGYPAWLSQKFAR